MNIETTAQKEFKGFCELYERVSKIALSFNFA